MWKRKDDNLGIAFSGSGLSQENKDYLSSKCYGFIIGDGKLNYSDEMIMESIYSFQIVHFLTVNKKRV